MGNDPTLRATSRAMTDRRTGRPARGETGAVASRQAESPRSEARGLGKACDCPPLLVHNVHPLFFLYNVNMVVVLFSAPPEGTFFFFFK